MAAPGKATPTQAWRIVSAVVDPEIPVLTIEDLGVLRALRIVDDHVEVDITPTYSGCPAMNAIAIAIEAALARAGFPRVRVKMVLAPTWTTDWMSEEGRRKLKEYGVAPPRKGGGRRALFDRDQVACPQCDSTDTCEIAAFGSTPCKALWRCNRCREPFDYFKCH
jgi:ring-1,2-phenylacetyl-CoA epoxidase subunit PaaD